MHDILIRPLITEQSMADAEKGKFTFIVALSADKPEVKTAIEEAYKVKVLDIATIIMKGRTKRVGKKRTEKKLGSYKKAVITLGKGQKIDAFELGEQKK